MKHTKDIDGRVVLHKRAVEMINEATTNDLGKEDIPYNFCAPWKCVCKEECFGLDSDGLFGMQDANEELKDTDEDYSDFTGGNMVGAAESADELNNDDSTAIDLDEKLIRELDLAAQQLDMSRFTNLNQRLEEVRSKKTSDPTLSDTLPTISLPHAPSSILPQAEMKTLRPPPSHPILLPNTDIPPLVHNIPSSIPP